MIATKKLISNTLYLFLNWFVLTILSLLYWFIVGKSLLPEEYGIISTSLNLVIVLSEISLLGLNVAVCKLVPEYLARKTEGKIKSLIRFSLKMTLVSNLSFIIILFSLSSFILPILKIPLTALLLTSTILITLSFYSQTGAIIYGFQNMRRFLTTDFFGQVTKVSISAILIFLGFRYLGPLIGLLLGLLVTTLMRFFSITLIGKKEKIDQKLIMLNYALPAFIAGLARIFFINGQYILLTILHNLQTTGIFTIAMILTSPISVIPNILTSALFPIISQLSVNHNLKKKQRYLIGLVFRYSLFISLPIVIFLILFSKQAILLFSRSEYLPAAQLFPILALAAIIFGCGNIFLSSIYALGKPKINRNIMIATTSTFLALAIPLTYEFSAFGLASAYTISVAILFLISLIYIRKYIRLTISFSYIVKPLIASSISLVFLYFIIPLTNLWISILFAFVSGLIYLTILLSMRFYIKEDVVVLRFLVERLPIFKRQTLSLIRFISRFI